MRGAGSDGVVVAWHKQPGEAIRRDEALVDIETDKVVLEVPAPEDGVLEKIIFTNGDTVVADQVIGIIRSGSVDDSAENTGKPTTDRQQPAAQGKDGKPLGPAARKLVQIIK